jgi:hypothetical protein
VNRIVGALWLIGSMLLVVLIALYTLTRPETIEPQSSAWRELERVDSV